MVGHPSRAERRETARQLAKQMLKEKRYKPSRSSVVWTIVSIAIPIAWMETVRGPAVWKVAVGWTLWLIPLVPAGVLMWRWWTGTKKLLAFRYVMVLVIVAGFAAISTWS